MLIHTFFHEAFHQFIAYYVPTFQSGSMKALRSFLTPALVNRKSLTLSKSFTVAGALQQLQNTIKAGKAMPLQRVVNMTRDQFYSGNVSLNYKQAWAFVWYMTSHSSMKPIYQNMFQRLANAEDPAVVQKEIFAKVKWDRLDKAWQKWVLKQKLPRSVDKYSNP